MQFLAKQEEFTTALQILEEGIDLAREKNSFYFLEELFELKGHVFVALDNQQAADESFCSLSSGRRYSKFIEKWCRPFLTSYSNKSNFKEEKK